MDAWYVRESAKKFFNRLDDWQQYDTRMILGGGFKYVLFSPLLGEASHFDSGYYLEKIISTFPDGWSPPNGGAVRESSQKWP